MTRILLISAGIFLAGILHVNAASMLPAFAKSLICKKNDPELNRCLLNSIESAKPYFIEGIKELGIPSMDPLFAPYVSVNRTLSDMVGINSVLRNVNTTGMGNFIIDHLNVDPIKMTFDIRYTMPWTHQEMEYDVSGQLLHVPLNSKGLFKGNFSDTQMALKGTFETYERDGETYYRIKKMTVKGQVGDGRVQMTAENPDLQFGASYVPRCFRNDPKLNECLLKATETIKPFLIKGIPELDVPSIEPFVIPEIDLEQGSQALNFKAKLKNITIHGLSSYHMDQFDFDVPNLQFFCGGAVDKLDLTGSFKVTGKILIAPIEGEGTFKAAVGKSKMKVYQKYKIIQKKGQDHISPIHTNSSIEVGEPMAELSGLFENNEQLNKATNEVIKENINILFEDLKPVLEKVITNFLEIILLKQLTDQVPFDKLYPIKKD